MQAQFAQDNNPDAQTLQKLADMTGLSRRVIQVGERCSEQQAAAAGREALVLAAELHDVLLRCVFIGVVSKLQSKT